MIIVDTNVLAELMRQRPNARVMSWMGGHPPAALFTTTVTQAEIFYGLALMPKGRRRSVLEEAALQVFTVDFADRVLPFDSAAALEFAQVAASRRQKGMPISQLDAQIAAIASSRRAGLATRNIRDFEGIGLELFDPWASPSA